MFTAFSKDQCPLTNNAIVLNEYVQVCVPQQKIQYTPLKLTKWGTFYELLNETNNNNDSENMTKKERSSLRFFIFYFPFFFSLITHLVMCSQFGPSLSPLPSHSCCFPLYRPHTVHLLVDVFFYPSIYLYNNNSASCNLSFLWTYLTMNEKWSNEKKMELKVILLSYIRTLDHNCGLSDCV